MLVSKVILPFKTAEWGRSGKLYSKPYNSDILHKLRMGLGHRNIAGIVPCSLVFQARWYRCQGLLEHLQFLGRRARREHSCLR